MRSTWSTLSASTSEFLLRVPPGNGKQLPLLPPLLTLPPCSIDYVVHGDDPCIVNGKDVYATAKAKGKYMTIPRTEGVSTTDIVGRMLLMSREHHEMRLDGEQEPRLASRRRGEMRGTVSFRKAFSVLLVVEPVLHTRASPALPQQIRSQFLTTSRMLRLFSAGVKAPPKGARVVYIDGAWDMFHSGHTLILKEAKRHGDYLIVGVFGDDVVNAQRGLNMPIMNLNERVLSVLGCGYADDVLIDAPPEVTKEMVASLGICKVMQGSTSDSSSDEESDKCYAVPKAMGIYQKLESPSRLTVKEIIGRIQKNQEAYEAKFTAKKRAEDEYYGRRYGLQDEADKLEPKVKSG
jgi:ethanolamine-phosphate cytidylyltransferase